MRVVERLERAIGRQPAGVGALVVELREHARILAAVARAAIVTIGNELVSGDVENSNGSWLARRLAALGVEVALIAVIRDDIEEVAAFVREQAASLDIVLVTGGLGGTPDDLTREAIAAAFGVPQVEQPDVAAALRARFTRDPSTRLAGPCSRRAAVPSTIRSAGRPGSQSGMSG